MTEDETRMAAAECHRYEAAEDRAMLWKMVAIGSITMTIGTLVLWFLSGMGW